ncbi:hypothetical protein B0T24DRAFT_279362 [Lasiosphaeria ovina]|uniref:Uncharacterized protein n=1 Tax=Lasiosphaeria ovina TaxID=92902 RepID=A0AAE0KBW3_9PEZI|nr:hypothetical protein B0T24DRAFT_279362 [Lasiosphaeria ovina]
MFLFRLILEFASFYLPRSFGSARYVVAHGLFACGFGRDLLLCSPFSKELDDSAAGPFCGPFRSPWQHHPVHHPWRSDLRLCTLQRQVIRQHQDKVRIIKFCIRLPLRLVSGHVRITSLS